MKKACLSLLCALCLLLALFPAQAAPLGGILDYAVVEGTEKLNLRAGPGTEYDWCGALEEGEWAGIMGEYGNWYSVFVLKTGQTGYMSKNYLKREGAAQGGAVTGVVSNPKPTQYLNLRAYPAFDAPVLGIYYNGSSFTLLSNAGSGWYQVQINSQTGFFRQEYVTLYGSSTGIQSAVITSPNSGKVNLRNAPSYSDSGVIGQYAPGVRAEVLLSSKKAGAFWKVRVNGKTGYMDSRFLTASSSPVYPDPYTPVYPDPYYPVNPSPAPATKGIAVVSNPKSGQYLNLRAQPSANARVIAQYKNGIRFQVITAGETWTKVYGSATGNVGYFMTKYLKLSGVSTTKTVSNGNSYVNLRSSPKKVSNNIRLQVPSGAAVTVLIPGDEWTQVRYNGTVGYMMTSFLK